MSDAVVHPVEAEQIASHFRSALRRRKPLIALCLAGALVPVIILNEVTPPVYESATTLIFEEAPNPIPLPNALDSGGGYLVNHLEEIQSLSFAEEVARALPDSLVARLAPVAEGMAEPERLELAGARIHQSLAAEPVRKSNLVRIRVRLGDPELCMEIANTAAEVLQERNLRVKQEGVQGVRRFIEKQVNRFAVSLGRSEEALRRFKERSGITAFDSESQEILKRLTQAEVLYNTARANREAAEERLAAVESTVDKQKRQLAPSVTAIATPSAQKLKEKLIALQMQYTDFTVQNYPTDHPKLVALQQEIAETKRTLTEEAAKLARGENIGDPIAQIEKFVNESLSLQIDIESLRAQQAGLARIIQEYEEQLSGLPAMEFELARILREREVNQKIYMMLLEKLEESKISEAEQLPSIRVIDRAQLPGDPVAPQKGLNLALGLGLGLVLGLGLGIALESARGSLDLTQDFEKLTGWPVLTWVPPRRSKIARPRSAAAEAYELLKTQLEHAGFGSRHRSLMVTSLGPGDGKSTTLANLALAFATSGKKTLLVDTELRRPTLHTLFDIPQAPGLTDLLSGPENGGQAQLAEVGGAQLAEVGREGYARGAERGPASRGLSLQRPGPAAAAAAPRGGSRAVVAERPIFRNGPVPHLTIVASGTRVPNEKGVLSAPSMRALLDRLVAEHDVVLVDAAPLPLVHYAVVTARLVDAVLVVVDATAYDRDMILRVKNLLDRAEANVIGAVVNKADISGSYKRSYYRYYERS